MRVLGKLPFIPLCFCLLFLPGTSWADREAGDEPYEIKVVKKIIHTIDIDLAEKSISYDKEPVEMKNPLPVDEGSVMIPLRLLAQAAGYDTYLNLEKGTVFITKGTDKFALDLDREAKYIDGAVYVPIDLVGKFPNLGMYAYGKDNLTVYSHGPKLESSLPNEFFQDEISVALDVESCYRYNLFLNYQPVSVKVDGGSNLVELKLNKGDNLLSFEFVHRKSMEKSNVKLILDRVHSSAGPAYHINPAGIEGLGLQLDKSLNYFNSTRGAFTLKGNVHATHITVGATAIDSKQNENKKDLGLEQDIEDWTGDSGFKNKGNDDRESEDRENDYGKEERFKVIPNEKFDFSCRLDLNRGVYKITIYQPYMENSRLFKGERLAHFFLEVR